MLLLVVIVELDTKTVLQRVEDGLHTLIGEVFACGIHPHHVGGNVMLDVGGLGIDGGHSVRSYLGHPPLPSGIGVIHVVHA